MFAKLEIKQTRETDVLVVGGGIGGLMAAVGAASGSGGKKPRVLVAEKANTKRSGSGATGNDHFLCYIPELHGDELAPIIKETQDSLVGMFHDPLLTRIFLEKSFTVAKMWQEFGINMQPSGSWQCMGHAFPGRPRIWLKYDGHNQKLALTKAAKNLGAEILNHHPIVDLLVENGCVTGALALNIRDSAPSLLLIRAKAVILATGTANRLYSPAGTPASLFNTAFCPSCTGAAQAQAWRAGAKLVNLEMPNRHAGPKFLARCGKSTWIGLYKYPDGKLLGPFVTKPTRELGDITADVWNSAFTDLIQNGKGPAYLDCSHTAPDDLAFMRAGMESEGLTSLLDYMAEKNIDPKQHAVEFMQYEPHLIGRGLEINAQGQTSLPGLYATGDMVGNFRADIAGAAVFGWIGGQAVAEEVLKAEVSIATELAADNPIYQRLEFYNKIYSQAVTAAPWQEANKALQQIMNDYAAAGPYRVRSATLLQAGLKYLQDLRQLCQAEVKAGNAHELMRAIETFDLMDCAEVLMLAALERKESRGMHLRSDYTFTNPLLTDQFLTIRQEKGQAVLEWRKRWN